MDSELVCVVCHDPLCDPVVEPQCRQMFCRACIVDWLKRYPTCPQCRHTLNVSSLAPAPRFITNTLDALLVVCPICTKHFERKALADHFDKCPIRTLVSCLEKVQVSTLMLSYLQHADLAAVSSSRELSLMFMRSAIVRILPLSAWLKMSVVLGTALATPFSSMRCNAIT